MKHYFAVLIILFAMTAIPGYTFAAPNMEPGQWKMTGQMEMPGMPMQMPAVTYHQCITRKDMVPRSKQSQDCKMVKNSTQGDTLKWQMQCNNQGGPTTMDGEVTYSGKTMKGTIKINQGGRQMLQRISGQWVGPCQ